MTKWAKVLLLTLIPLFLASSASAQGSLYRDIAWRYTPAGVFPATTATVTLCTSAATGTPCTPKITIYSDSGLTLPVTNPLIPCVTSGQVGCIDGLGNFSFYAAQGSYSYTVTGAGLSAYGPIPFGLSCVAGSTCVSASANNAFSGNNSSSGTWLSTGTSNTFCRFENFRYVDPANLCGWAGSDFGAWYNSALADLPLVTVNSNTYKQGRIYFGAPASATLAVTVSTAMNNPGPFVSVEGPGSQALMLSCTVNGDCLTVHDWPYLLTNFFGDNRGSTIKGFSIIGQGSGNANAVGIHTGDLNDERFEDITIDNFTGANSSCFWADNQIGWYERNRMTLSIGEHETTATEVASGCTKLIRLTTSVNVNAPSFANGYWDVKLSPRTGQIGFSFEATNPFVFYASTIVGKANQSAGSTLISLTGGTPVGRGNFVFLNTESTGAATGWSATAGSTFSYMGPGIVENVLDGANISDSLAADTLSNHATPTQRRSYSFGSPIAGPTNGQSTLFSSHYIPFAGAADNFLTGFGVNAWFDGTNFRTAGDGVSNGGMMIVSSAGSGFNPGLLYSFPTTGGTFQTIAPGSVNNFLRGFLAAVVASGTATMTTAAIGAGACGTTVIVPATNVLTTDSIAWSYNAAPAANPAQLVVSSWPTANNVNFQYCNPSAGSITPAAATLNWRVPR